MTVVLSLLEAPPAAKLAALPCTVDPSACTASTSRFIPEAVFSMVRSCPVESNRSALFSEVAVAVTPVLLDTRLIFDTASVTLELLIEKLLTEWPFMVIV